MMTDVERRLIKSMGIPQRMLDDTSFSSKPTLREANINAKRFVTMLERLNRRILFGER